MRKASFYLWTLGLFLAVILVTVLLFPAQAADRESSIDWRKGSFLSMQPSGHRLGTDVTYTAGKWSVKNQKGQATVAVGVTVRDTSDGGVLRVHLVDDYTAAGARVYCNVPLAAGLTGIIFDEIDSAGTTLPKSEFIIWF
jgi:hypothetical protein